MSLIYKIDSQVKKKFPNLKSTVDSKAVQEIVESIIGERTSIDFIKNYLSDKGYSNIDIPEEFTKTKIIDFKQRIKTDIETFDKDKEDQKNLDDEIQDEDEDNFDLDAFFESTDFINSMEKANKQPDYSKNKELFGRLATEQSETIKHEIIVANLPLVNKIASKYIGQTNCSFDYDDLVSEGIFGLMKAVDRFDVALGYEFSTYSYNWIKQTITRAIADKALSIRLPVHLHETLNKINHIERESWKETDSINSQKIADQCEISIEKYAEMKMIEYRYRHSTSINTPLKDNPDEDILMLLGREYSIWLPPEIDQTDPVQAANYTFMKQEVEKLFELLLPKEEYVLRQRFGLDDDTEKTLEEVGHLLGVTRERVRQIQAKAIRKLINSSKKMELEEFLLN